MVRNFQLLTKHRLSSCLCILGVSFTGRITFERKSYRDGVWNERRTIQSKERMDKSFKWANFPGNDLKISIHSVVLPVKANIAQSLKRWLGEHCSGGSKGCSGGSPLLNSLWKWNNLVSKRPNYLIFMGYLRQMRQNQQSEPSHLYTYGPHFKESLIRPCIWRYTWNIRSSEWFKHPLFRLMVLRSFVKINLLFNIMDPLKHKSPHLLYISVFTEVSFNVIQTIFRWH